MGDTQNKSESVIQFGYSSPLISGEFDVLVKNFPLTDKTLKIDVGLTGIFLSTEGINRDDPNADVKLEGQDPASDFTMNGATLMPVVYITDNISLSAGLFGKGGNWGIGSAINVPIWDPLSFEATVNYFMEKGVIHFSETDKTKFEDMSLVSVMGTFVIAPKIDGLDVFKLKLGGGVDIDRKAGKKTPRFSIVNALGNSSFSSEFALKIGVAESSTPLQAIAPVSTSWTVSEKLYFLNVFRSLKFNGFDAGLEFILDSITLAGQAGGDGAGEFNSARLLLNIGLIARYPIFKPSIGTFCLFAGGGLQYYDIEDVNSTSDPYGKGGVGYGGVCE